MAAPTTITPVSTTTTTLATTQATTVTPPTSATTTTTIAPVSTNAIYVSSSGSDSGAGTQASPYRTIQNAINKAPSGTTIYVIAGTYNEKLVVSGKVNLTITNYPGQTPVLSGTGFTGGNLVDIGSSSGIQFSGFEITNFWAAEFEVIYIKNGCKNIEISNNKIHDLGTTATGSSGNVHGVLVKGTTPTALTNITVRNNEFYNLKTGYSESLTVQGNVDGFIVAGNYIHNNTNIGIDIAGFYSTTTISDATMNQARNGLVTGNTISDLYCDYATCAGIYVDGGRDTIIEYNTVSNDMTGIEIGCENATDRTTGQPAIVKGIVVRYNVIYNNTSKGMANGGYDGLNTGKIVGTQIYNNTLYKNRRGIDLEYCDNTAIHHNIIYSPGSSSYFIYDELSMATNLTSNNNLFFSEDATAKYKFNGAYAYSLPEWQTKFSQDAISKFVDPLFLNKNTFDFRLQPGSPATGIGAK